MQELIGLLQVGEARYFMGVELVEKEAVRKIGSVSPGSLIFLSRSLSAGLVRDLIGKFPEMGIGFQGRVLKDLDTKPPRTVCDVKVLFDEGGKCTTVECSCSSEPHILQPRTREKPSIDFGFTMESTPGSRKSATHGCEHVAALLIAAKAKQEEQERTKVSAQNENGASRRPRLTMYVNPERKCTLDDQTVHTFYTRLNAATMAFLKEKLKANGMNTSGKKIDLVARILDAICFGAPPRCPKCHQGTLRYNNGHCRCPGYFHSSAKVMVDCDFECEWEEIKRKPWVD